LAELGKRSGRFNVIGSALDDPVTCDELFFEAANVFSRFGFEDAFTRHSEIVKEQ